MMESTSTRHDNIAALAPAEATEEDDDFIESVECNEENAEIIMADSKLMKKTPVVFGHRDHENHDNSASNHYLIKCRSSTCSHFYKDLASLLTHEMKDHKITSSTLVPPKFKTVTVRNINIYLDDCSKRPRFNFRPRHGRRRGMKQHSSNEQEDEDEKRDPTIIPGGEDSDDSEFDADVGFDFGEPKKRGRPRKNQIPTDPPNPPPTVNKTYKCKVCRKTLANLKGLKAHINRRHDPNPSKTFRCRTCQLELPTEHKLRLHTKATKHYQSFYCSICPAKFTRVPDLTSHFVETHLPSGVKPNQCTICSKSFGKFYLARKHERLAHTKGRFTCSVCAKSFYNFSHWSAHEARHDRQRPRNFPCSFCEGKYFTKEGRNMHEDRVHKKVGRESWVYCQCGRGFKDENGMKYHVCSFYPPSLNVMHEPEVIVNADGQIELCPIDPLQLDQNDKTAMVKATSLENPPTSSSVIKVDADSTVIKEDPKNPPVTSLSSIKVDVERMTIKNPPTEDIIDIQYEGTLQARFNILPEESENDEARAPAKDDEEYILPGKSSDAPTPSASKSKSKGKKEQSLTKSSSTQPTLIKVPTTGSTCLHCSKTFSQRNYLKIHVSKMNKKLFGVQFICDFPLCGKVLANSTTLKLHLERHTSLACKFKCKECGHAFQTSSGHLYHMRKHTGEKPFKCSAEGCNAAFIAKHHLLLHELRNHTKIRKFTCSYCDKKFLLKSQLTQHERMHTGEKPLLCKYCGLGFGRYSTREKHQKKHLIYLGKKNIVGNNNRIVQKD